MAKTGDQEYLSKSIMPKLGVESCNPFMVQCDQEYLSKSIMPKLGVESCNPFMVQCDQGYLSNIRYIFKGHNTTTF
jgi:hypothetical protein